MPYVMRATEVYTNLETAIVNYGLMERHRDVGLSTTKEFYEKLCINENIDQNNEEIIEKVN